MELSEEDKKFLEEKFGDGSDMSQTTPEEWERYRKIKEEERKQKIPKKKETKPIYKCPECSSINHYTTATHIVCKRCGHKEIKEK